MCSKLISELQVTGASVSRIMEIPLFPVLSTCKMRAVNLLNYSLCFLDSLLSVSAAKAQVD